MSYSELENVRDELERHLATRTIPGMEQAVTKQEPASR